MGVESSQRELEDLTVTDIDSDAVGEVEEDGTGFSAGIGDCCDEGSRGLCSLTVRRAHD